MSRADQKRSVSGKTEGRVVRMRDVAELAGVGTMTVSRVLSGTVRVTEDTAQRVYRAIDELQYRPNQVARALRGSSSNTIGIILPYLYDPFFATCAHAISTTAQKHAYSTIITTTDEDPRTELEQASQMLRRHVDGLLIIPTSNSRANLTAPEFRNLPIVTIDRPVPGSGLDAVTVDNKAGGYDGTRHLIEHGHRRISFIGLSKRLYTMRERFAGYERAMLEAGLVPEPHFDCNDESRLEPLLRTLRRRGSGPTALFCANGLVTRYALHALSRLDIPVPDGVALVAFDDFELADILQPALTVVRQPIQQLGHVAAELLFSRLVNDGSALPRQSVVLPVELVVRRSCGCAGTTARGATRATSSNGVGAD